MSARRLLLVHLFLPETLNFHDWPEDGGVQASQYKIPSQAQGDYRNAEALAPSEAPSSPPSTNKDLEVDELNERLSRASLEGGRRQPFQDGHHDDAMSDSEGPALPPILETNPGNDATAGVSSSSTKRTTKSARSSFSEQNKKVSMTSLMAEATATRITGPQDTALTTSADSSMQKSLHRGSSGDARGRRASGSRSEEATPLPVAASSDHGRGASTKASPVGKLTPQSGTAQSVSLARSRRGSESGKTAGTMLTVPTPGPSTTRDRTPDLQGTRTPGAKAGGKAGTLTPLSIIGDLAAKQSHIAPRQMPTTGDTDRHHPFGSGAVTPMREQLGTVSSGSRTPGTRPHPHHALSRSGAMGLTLSKVQEHDGNDRAKEGRPQLIKTPSRSNPKIETLSTSGNKASSDDWTLNDHGRGADAAPSAQQQKRPKLANRQLTSSHLGNQRPADASARRSPMESPALLQGHPLQHKDMNTAHIAGPSQGPPQSASAHIFGRSASKARVPSRMSRRQSSFGGRTTQRMSMIESSDDNLLASMEESSPGLPPFDFVPNPSANGGLNNAVRSLAKERLHGGVRYIGTPGVTSEGWAGKEQKDFISARMKEERDMVPVWVDDEVFDAAYPIYCKQILWPTFHYTLPTGKGHDHEHDAFDKYRLLNACFADMIVKEYREGDIIFVNDYHLLLVPLMVRERLPHSKICFFLHIAWPSSEIFRCLSARTHILRGMLGADLVGFQTANFARHFRQTVSRILQHEATPKGIQIDARGGFVAVGTFPIGIDVAQLNERRKQPDVAEWVDRLRERYEGKKVIVGRDKLDFIKGVRQKLLAFEAALDEHKELVGKVVLLQVALSTTEENEEVAMATDVVARINNKHSSLTYQPVVFLHVQDITFCQYLALLTVADAFLATSLREGMNLTSHEFVICQEQKHKPLILSEFTGTYSSLRACIGINPWNTKQVADAIFKAITMGDDEARERWKDLHRQVTTQDAQHWIQSLLGRLERAHIDQQRRNNTFMPRLEIGQSEWRASKSRLLLIDLEESLIDDDPLASHERGFEPPEKVVKVLQELTADAKNRVYILSGKGAHDLDKILRDVPRLGAVAENGCAIMYAGSPPASERENGVPSKKAWTSLVAGTNMSWRESVKEILTYFTERTPGSWLEDRGASILWRFWSGRLDERTDHLREFQWAKRQAAEVQNLIYDSLGERFSLRIIPGSKSFLIMPKNTSRASAIQHIISLSSVGAQTLGGGRDAFLHMPAVTTQRSDGDADIFEPPTPATAIKPAPDFLPLARTQLSQAPPPSSHLTAQTHGNDTAALFRQPSNAWSAANDMQHYSVSTLKRAEDNAHLLHPYGLGSFDLVLCIGQDDTLFAYINSLDLSFAPITCTSCGKSGTDGRGVAGGGFGVGSEASYYVNGPEEVMSSLYEILAFRGRDQRWGVPAMVDV